MFGKKKDKDTKVNEFASREILKKKIKEEVEDLSRGQAIIYLLPEYYSFGPYLGVEMNPTFPQKGKKYLMFTDEMAEGKPAGKKTYVTSTNKELDYADWVAEKDGDNWGHVKRCQ
jgi:hypothetical protein